jgi:hypothetical protein
MFHVGQKVVCVDDEPRVDRHPTLIHKGHIYTIHAVIETPLAIGVQLAEVAPYADKVGWHIGRFRPVTERKTDISIFTAMLTGAPNELEQVDG